MLPLGEADAEWTVAVPRGSASSSEEPWRLTLDAEGRPVAWMRAGSRIPAGDGHVAGAGLRSALDAVLASPAEAAVVVEEGRAAGWVQRSAVLTALSEPVDDA